MVRRQHDLLDQAVEILNSDERIAAYLEEAFEGGTPSVIASALGTVARARNFSMIARDTGLTRETLYKALSAEDIRPYRH